MAKHPFLVKLKRKSTAWAKSERGPNAREFTWGRELAGCRNLGRKRERALPAQRRARIEENGARQRFAFLGKRLVWERV